MPATHTPQPWAVPSDQRNWPPFSFVRAALILAGIVAVLAAVVCGALAGIGRPAQIRPCLLSAALCLATGLLGLIPVAWLSRKHPHGSAQGFLASIGIRMLVTGGVVVALMFNQVPGAFGLSMWIGGWYLVVLAVEARLVSSHALAHAATLAHGPGFRTGPEPAAAAPTGDG